jgi:hypothetical protein
MGPNHVLHFHLIKDEIYDVLHGCDDEPNEGHFATKRTIPKILHPGY